MEDAASYEVTPPAEPKKVNQGSFCIPHAAIEALLDAQATAYEICAYLTLARFTDATGVYSVASVKAVNTYTGASKTKSGPIAKAIARLKTIHAKRVEKVANGRSGKSHAMIDKITDMGPILYDRQGWLEKTGEILPDGAIERLQVLHVLPDFGEPVADRVWIGNNLVTGFGEFKKPLKAIKDGGDVVARLLLTLYQANDMETWGGIDPRKGSWRCYESVSEDVALFGGGRLIRSKRGAPISAPVFQRAFSSSSNDWWKAHKEAREPVWRALELLEDTGLIYEVVLVLNRNAEIQTLASGAKYGAIPQDAEPLYELDARSQHGYKPEGEEGLGGITASTAGDLGHPVAISGGTFDGTYAAIVKRGQGAMIAGVYRLRFRVANTKNAGVSQAWARIHENNQEHLEFIQSIRAANCLDPALSPAEAKKAAIAAKETAERLKEMGGKLRGV